jgi:assimilatory nitrate reductase catalytic subunit
MAVAARGKVVCTCFNVTDARINTQLATCMGSPAERLAALQGALHCGTNCGSCLPELRRLVRMSPEPLAGPVLAPEPVGAQ